MFCGFVTCIGPEAISFTTSPVSVTATLTPQALGTGDAGDGGGVAQRLGGSSHTCGRGGAGRRVAPDLDW